MTTAALVYERMGQEGDAIRANMPMTQLAGHQVDDRREKVDRWRLRHHTES